MPQHDATQLARSPLLLLHYAEQHGLNRDALIREASLTSADLADPDSRIPVVSMHKLWRAVIMRNTDPELGLKIGQTVTAKRMGLVGYAMNFSDNLLDALLNLSRYARLISDASQFRILRVGNDVLVRATVRPYMIALRHPIDASMTSILTVAREITHSNIAPREVRLPSAQPASVEAYRAAFGGAVTFATPSAEMVFTTRQMATPVKNRDELLSNYLSELAKSKLSVLGARDPDFIDRVRRGIWTTLQIGKPSLLRTAASLSMSARTLQRRLERHGTSFSMVLEQLRRELSEDLRQNKNYAASEVAFLLGYSEPSAYQRAARRWRDSGPDNSQAS